jgi:four helix bundle protein
VLQRFEHLEVWKKSHGLVIEVYRLTANFPNEEKFGLTSQMRRSAVSIPANIAEGFKRAGLKDKAHFYNISQASLEELRYYFILSRDLNYQIDFEKLNTQADEVGRMLYALIQKTRA